MCVVLDAFFFGMPLRGAALVLACTSAGDARVAHFHLRFEKTSIERRVVPRARRVAGLAWNCDLSIILEEIKVHIPISKVFVVSVQ